MMSEALAKPLRLLVCGNRELESDAWRACVRAWLEAVDVAAKRRGIGVSLAHGAAKGADLLASTIGVSLGWNVVPYPANWDKHGDGAGPRRNREMFAMHRPMRGLAFGRITRGVGRARVLTGTGDMVAVMNEGACLVTVVPAANFLP
jgi:hypothetical protein